MTIKLFETEIEAKDQLARNLRNSYLRQWRKENPEKVKAYRKKYWEKRAEEILTNAKNN